MGDTPTPGAAPPVVRHNRKLQPDRPTCTMARTAPPLSVPLNVCVLMLLLIPAVMLACLPSP
jgi:hypothetical protein